MKGVLRLKNGKEFEVDLGIENFEKKKTLKDKVSCLFLTKTKALEKLTDKNNPISSSEAKKAMEGLAKFLSKGTKSGKKTAIFAEMGIKFEEKGEKQEGERRVMKNVPETLPEESTAQGLSNLGVRGTESGKNPMVIRREANKELEDIRATRDGKIFSRESADHWKGVMGRIIVEAARKESIGEEKLNGAKAKFEECLEKLEELQDPPTKEQFLEHAKATRWAVLEALDTLEPGKSEQLFEKYYGASLSQDAEAWKSFSGEVELIKNDGGKMQVVSSLKSAKEMECFAYLGDGPGKKRGISSMERDTEFAVNLWETEIKTKDSDKPLFQAIRHGCTKGKEGASKEVLTACLVQKLGGIGNVVPSEVSAKGPQANPHELQLSNIQLMTPGIGIAGLTDGKMPRKQIKKFKELAESKNQPIELKIPAPNGQSVWIKLEEPLLFNFGVNLQQFKGVVRESLVAHAPVTRRLREHNAESFKLLMGDTSKIAESKINDSNAIDLNKEKKLFDEESKIGKFLSNAEVSDSDKKVVVQLAHQIAYLWESGECEKNGSEPDAIVARLALLSDKLDLSTSFNCKSGKDRTGEVNVSIEHLAAEIEMNGGIVPKPYHELDDREKLNLNNMLICGAADHVTTACTGAGGLKLVSSFGIVKFSGVEDRLGEVRGASELATEKPGSLKDLRKKYGATRKLED
ncbi:MAG: hypothetical protein LBI77_01825 [Puniceicoccales bacterium]|nr:hypothetical protein [Puniceicoccales bacterium]